MEILKVGSRACLATQIPKRRQAESVMVETRGRMVGHIRINRNFVDVLNAESDTRSEYIRVLRMSLAPTTFQQNVFQT